MRNNSGYHHTVDTLYRGLWEYYKQLYTNKYDNLENMNRFLESYTLLKLNHEKVENLNSSTTIVLKKWISNLKSFHIQKQNKELPGTYDSEKGIW